MTDRNYVIAPDPLDIRISKWWIHVLNRFRVTDRGPGRIRRLVLKHRRGVGFFVAAGEPASA